LPENNSHAVLSVLPKGCLRFRLDLKMWELNDFEPHYGFVYDIIAAERLLYEFYAQQTHARIIP